MYVLCSDSQVSWCVSTVDWSKISAGNVHHLSTNIYYETLYVVFLNHNLCCSRCIMEKFQGVQPTKTSPQ